MEIKTDWDFVQKYYPNYSSSNEIAENDDLHKICDGEINGYAEEMYNEKIEDLKIFWGVGSITDEIENEAFKHFKALRDESDSKIYAEAIEGFLESQKGTAKIVWSIRDFESRAKDNFERNAAEYWNLKTWKDLYDETRFSELLEKMIASHDATLGINWGDVDECLILAKK